MYHKKNKSTDFFFIFLDKIHIKAPVIRGKPGNPLLEMYTVVQITVIVYQNIKANFQLHFSENNIEK